MASQKAWARKGGTDHQSNAAPPSRLCHFEVTRPKKWETKEERDRGKLAADFYLCSARFDLQADEGVSCEFETLFIVMYCGTMSSCDAIVVQCTIVMQLWCNCKAIVMQCIKVQLRPCHIQRFAFAVITLLWCWQTDHQHHQPGHHYYHGCQHHHLYHLYCYVG